VTASKGPRTPVVRVRPSEPKRPRKACQQAPHVDWCLRLFNDPDPRVAGLRAQAKASLWQAINQAEARLNKLIDAPARRHRRGYRALLGGRDE
jgi:hypothetical protein